MIKILLAIDGSKNSTKAVDHVAQIASHCNEVAVTLYYVLGIRKLAKYGESVDPEEEARLSELVESKTEASIEAERQGARNQILDPAEDRIRQKAPKAQVSGKFSPVLHRDVARTIVQEAEHGDYDVIALGRRGRSALADLAFGSVSSGVVHHARHRAVWVID